jgi:hypothetical protein
VHDKTESNRENERHVISRISFRLHSVLLLSS